MRCDIRHLTGVPAVVFSMGGYTGNVYHEFSDGLIPLCNRSRHVYGYDRRTGTNGLPLS